MQGIYPFLIGTALILTLFNSGNVDCPVYPLSAVIKEKEFSVAFHPQTKTSLALPDSVCGEYGMDPDSLYASKTAIRKIYSDLKNEEEADNILAHSSAYPIFLKKMEEIRKNDVLVKRYGLGAGVKIIEYVELTAYPGRALVLWMCKPRVMVSVDELYTCPDVTVGKGYFSGISKISLVDTKLGKLINTEVLDSPELWESNEAPPPYSCIDIPFAIRNPKVTKELAGLKYHATGGTDSTEGKAQLLYLEDFNGDGKKLEFAFYQQEGCMGCSTTLFGYSPKQDKIIHYSVVLNVLGYNQDEGKPMRDTTYTSTNKWIDQAFCFRFNKKGELNYDQDYRGRGGSWDRYSLKYNAEGEYFSGTLNYRPQEGDDSVHVSWFRMPELTK
jgi:hypothetical protein